VPNAPCLNASDFTIEFWVQRLTNETREPVLYTPLAGISGVNFKGLVLSFAPNTNLDFKVNSNVSLSPDVGYADRASPTALSWAHLSITFTYANLRRGIFKNGESLPVFPYGAAESGGKALAPPRCTESFRLGSASLAMDEFRLWLSLRTDAEIKANFDIQISAAPLLAVSLTFEDSGTSLGGAVTTAPGLQPCLQCAAGKSRPANSEYGCTTCSILKPH
jgi:hypothetical protein